MWARGDLGGTALLLRRQLRLLRGFSTVPEPAISGTNYPEYVLHRLRVWDTEFQRQRCNIVHKNSITINLSDGTAIPAVANVDTPLSISKGRFSRPVVARINGTQLIDIKTNLRESCSLEFLSFDDPEGKLVFWHSAAHVLGQVLEWRYLDQVHLCDGPSLKEGGFFYEMKLEDGLTVHDEDLGMLQKRVLQIIKEKQPFEHMEISREVAREMFQYNPFKLELLDKIPLGDRITVYKCGPFIDLCRGPHVPSTGMLSAFSLIRCAGSKGKSSSDFLQRVYGIAFPQKAQLQEWNTLQEEAKKRDHRVIGTAQSLFMFHQMSPGSSFVLPHGTRIYNKLCDLIREQYRNRGYQEVITPILYKKELWETSGHLQNYEENMFRVTPGFGSPKDKDGHHGALSLEEDSVSCGHSDHSAASPQEEFGLKPMNCPGHCLIFRDSRHYSYRDLPVRLADFSALHRNEASGALSGLTRVRRFHQDDAHIFCTPDQIQSEIQSCLEFLDDVYGIFGFEWNMRLSTRPEKYVGEIPTWNEAERQLKEALTSFGKPWELNEGDGAFYGPKIDITVTDALKREHQCATIQLDFQLPQRFRLTYKGQDGNVHTPIIIHRAILGSVERFLAILIEHTAGRWPFWLSPRQVAILPVSEDQVSYAEDVARSLHEKGFHVDVAHSRTTLQKRIRESQLAAYNYILVVGETEVSTRTVNVRTRDNVVHGCVSVPQLIEDLQKLVAEYK